MIENRKKKKSTKSPAGIRRGTRYTPHGSNFHLPHRDIMTKQGQALIE